MHRFHLPPELCLTERLQLSPRDAHHAADVLRLKPGDGAVVLDGCGHEFVCEVLEASRRSTLLRVRARRDLPGLPCSIALIQSVAKAKAMDALLQKATELGVRVIYPVLTENCTVHIERKDAADKRDKWQQLVVEAVKQSGAAWMPQIAEPASLASLLTRLPQAELSMVGALRAGARHPRECFRKFEQQHGRRPASIALWVGPEGDFTDAELAAIENTGAQPVTLGPQILRCDTAATCLAAIAAYEILAPA